MMPRTFITILTLAAAVLAGCGPDPVHRKDELATFRGYLNQQVADVKIDPNIPLTPRQCEDLALAGSLDLRVRLTALQLQDDAVRIALSNGMPKGTAAYGETLRSNANLVEKGGVVSEVAERHQKFGAVQAVMPALDFGVTWYAYQIALDRQRQEALLVDRSIQLLRRDVRIAYARHAGARRQERNATIAYQAGLQVLRVAKSLENARMTVPADTALVEAAVAQANLELAQTRQRVQESHLLLSQMMSLPPGVEFTIDDALPASPPVPTAQQVAELEEGALQSRPELAVQDLGRRISASSVRKEMAAFFPHVDLNASFNWTGAAGVVNPAWFVGGFSVTHSLLDGGATLWRYNQAKTTVEVEKQRSLLVSLGVLYDVEFRALRVRLAADQMTAARTLEASRRAGLDRIVSLYKEGLEDEAGAARSLADLTTQAVLLDQAQTEYLVAWHELEAAALPKASPSAAAATQPTSKPVDILQELMHD